jgi:pyruvate,water dikinase
LPGIYQRLAKLWAGGGGHERQADVQRAALGVRYQSYRQLLKANSRALRRLAELQIAAQQAKPPSMSSLREASIDAALAGFQMVRELESLSGGSEPELMECFRGIWQGLDDLLTVSKPEGGDGPLVVALMDEAAGNADLVGPKMAELARLGSHLGLRVPRGFVITARAYCRFVEHNNLRSEIDRRLQIMDEGRLDELYATSSSLQRLFLEGALPPELARQIEQAVAAVVDGRSHPVGLAVRSSALAEDRGGASFAGQFTSLLGVPPNELAYAYREVIASAYGPQALSYYLAHGLRDQDLRMAVGCLEMVDARAGGVAYSTSPTRTQEPGVHISACWGLPKAIVDGGHEAQHVVVTAEGDVVRRQGRQTRAYQPAESDGVESRSLSDDLSQSTPLEDEQARELAEAVRRLERDWGGPVDVEWALDREGRLTYLQCRELLVEEPVEVTSTPLELPAPLLSGGVAASYGVAAGRVHWVQRGQDALTFAKGEVLVVERPLPRWAPLLRRANALVACEGGIAGHLATVAREYKIPALLGLGPINGRLADGDEVTVDATRLAVFPGILSELIASRAAPVHTVASPVSRILESVLRLLTPLNLPDSGEPGFTADACHTLHDLLRYCHQRGVEAMFRAGHNEDLSSPTARQLHYGRPMQWLILDLGGGTRKPEDERYVKPEEIICPAWQALWEGMLAVPWEGPPVSASGLGSVIAQASMRPDAASGGPAHREGNYFLLAEDYLHLQSKIGIHFAGVEVLAGPDREENFITFVFQGGGADLARQNTRLELMGEFLEKRGFSIEIRAGAARAHLEGPSQTEALTRLRALGYLLMHLRQLDIAMGDPALIAHYREKLCEDLKRIEATKNSVA